MRFLSNFRCKIIFMCSNNFWHQQDSNSLFKGSIGHVISQCKWPILRDGLPLCTMKEMVIFHVRCDLWCLYSCDVFSENNMQLNLIHSMHYLRLCSVVRFVKNDIKLCFYRRFIVPSLYNQITQLIFIMYIQTEDINVQRFGTLCLYEVNRFLSKFLTDHAAAAWIGGGKRFSWVSRAGAFSPLACLLACPFFTLSLSISLGESGCLATRQPVNKTAINFVPLCKPGSMQSLQTFGKPPIW